MERWDPDLFSTALAATLRRSLAAEPTPEHLVRLAAAAAEKVCEGRSYACGPGCPYCCVMNVAVLLPEAMVIAKWLEKNLPSEQNDLVRRLSRHKNHGRWMEDEERMAKQVYCPFLDSAGRCVIHPVRPLSCRGAASLDSRRCAEAFSPIIGERQLLVPADLLRQAAHDEAFSTLGSVLRDHGFDDRSIELGTGVLALVERPELREQFWSGGRLPRDLWQ